jgi:transcriptional regulator with XRE-family HTH domain
MLQIGLEIRLLREKLKLSAKDLSERVGLSPSQMSRLESGQRRVDVVLLAKIARALEVHPSYFYRDHDAASLDDEEPEGGEDSGEGSWDSRDSGRVSAFVPASPRGPSPLGKLIRAERRRRHMTPDELAQKIGKGRAFVQDVETGRTDLLSGELLAKITRTLKLDPEALYEAQRQEIRDLRKSVSRLERAHSDVTLGELELDEGGEEGSGRKGIPIVEAEDGGLPVEFTDGEAQGRVIDYLYIPGLRVARAFAIRWKGDAMERQVAPSFPAGEVLVFTPDREARHRDFVLALLGHDASPDVRRDGRTLFRRLFMDAKGLRLQPLNLDYPPLILDRDEVRELFVLVARLGTSL